MKKAGQEEGNAAALKDREKACFKPAAPGAPGAAFGR